MRRKLAEVVGELVGATAGEFCKAARSRTRPQCPFLAAAALPAFVVAIHKPLTLRDAQLLN